MVLATLFMLFFRAAQCNQTNVLGFGNGSWNRILKNCSIGLNPHRSIYGLGEITQINLINLYHMNVILHRLHL